MGKYLYICISREINGYCVFCEDLRVDEEDERGLFSCLGEFTPGPGFLMAALRSISVRNPHDYLFVVNDKDAILPSLLYEEIRSLSDWHNLKIDLKKRNNTE